MIWIYEKMHPILVGSEFRHILDRYVLGTRKAKMTQYGFWLQGGSHIAHRLMQEGAFEQDELALMERHLEHADIFVDIGANIGFYTCLGKHKGKHVIAVEPQQNNVEHLLENMLLNGWQEGMEIYPIGLSDKAGIAILYGASSTSASMLKSWDKTYKSIKQIIPVSTMDALIGDRFYGKRLLIKVDVEGVEYRVLNGALQTIQRNPKPVWIVEICLDEHRETVNTDYLATFELFYKNGYEASTADHRNKKVTLDDVRQWVRNRRCDSGAINYIFT